MKRILYSFVVVVLFISVASKGAFAQFTMNNNGGVVYITNGALVHVNGGLKNSSSKTPGYIKNEGLLEVYNDVTPGTIRLENSSKMEGSGTYRVEQDWDNNAFFNSDVSSVFLFGQSQQFITGSSVSNFHNLTLEGSGSLLKTMTLDSRINSNGILNLNDRELQTQGFVMHVDNDFVDAITRSPITTGGFVSSDFGGSLQRKTASTFVYLFPVGASGGTVSRYRPVDITPENTDGNIYGVRFANKDANDDNLPRGNGSIAGINNILNPNFYHTITRPEGTASADITIHYEPSIDGIYEDLWFWDTEKTLWRDALSTSSGPVRYFSYSSETRSKWAFTKPEDKHFILGQEGSGITELIPNIFTPNGDGFNDVFHVKGQNVKEYQVQIFDRWGILLFESSSTQIDWDGKTLAGADVPDGNYFYTIVATTMDDETIKRNGFVFLDR